jgi:hypothetical protein
VLRVIEYIGDRAAVEFTVNNSIQGEKLVKYNQYAHPVEGSVTIKVATIGNYPEILEQHEKA